MTRTRRVHFFCTQEETSDDNDCSEVSVEILGPLLVPSSEMAIDDKRDIWWQPKESKAFLENARMLGLESWSRDSKDDDTCYAQVLCSVYKSCKEPKAKGPNRKQRDKLSQWTKVAHSRRGIERICCRDMGVIRSQQKHEAIQGVLRAQKKLKSSSPEDKEHLLSMVSKTLTRPARLFAAVMGEADANAIRLEQDFENIWMDQNNKALIESSERKVFASLKICVRILRRASSNGVSRMYTRESKRRRSCS